MAGWRTFAFVTLLWSVAVVLLTAHFSTFYYPTEESEASAPHWRQRALQDASSQAQTAINRWYNSPRYTYFTSTPSRSLQQIGPGLCAPDANGNCRWPQYIESVFLISALGFIVAILSLLACPFVWILKCCTCGGCKASEGICCPSHQFNHLDGEGYSKKEVWLLLAFCTGTFVLALAFGIVGFVGTAGVTNAISDFEDAIIEEADDVLASLSSLQVAFENANVTSLIGSSVNVSGPLANAISTGQNIDNQVLNVKTEVNHYNSIRQGVMIAVFVVCVLLFLIPVISGVISFGKLSLITAIFGFFGMFCMWITFSIHYPIGALVSDACVELNHYETDPSSNSGISVILNCNQNSSAFSSLDSLANKTINQVVQRGCEALQQYCNETLPCPGANNTGTSAQCAAANCTQFNPNNNCTIQTVNSFPKNKIADILLGCPIGYNSTTGEPIFNSTTCPVDLSYNCMHNGQSIPLVVCAPFTYVEIEECANTCVSPLSMNISRTIVDSVNALDVVDNAIVNEIEPLLSCDNINHLVTELQDSICITLVNALFEIVLGSAFLGTLFAPALILSMMAYKRFNPRWQTYRLLNDGPRN